MIKDTGKVKDIAERFDVSSRMGTHGIGHTRFATESGVDRYHAHPYQSYIIPIVHYMADKLDQGYKLEEALDQAVIDLDGPFSILVGTPNGIGIAKDKLGLRPGVMVETDEIFAVASEEMALHDVTDSDEIEQIAPGETRAYTI